MMPDSLYSNSIAKRLTTARALTAVQVEELQRQLCAGCPIDTWPYGIPTSINPLVAMLGASPGNSPAVGDRDFITRASQSMPPSGHPHPGVYYTDTRGYWVRIRELAKIMLASSDSTKDDALALFANLNLGAGASGEANDAPFDSKFALWMLLNMRDNLRPRFVLCVGLLGYLRKNVEARRLFETLFDGFEYNKPHREYRFEAYSNRKYIFREWDTIGPKGNEIKIVFWPQHPVRHPFTVSGMWAESCREFMKHNGHLIS